MCANPAILGGAFNETPEVFTETLNHAPWSAPLSIPANVWKTWDTPAVISTA